MRRSSKGRKPVRDKSRTRKPRKPTRRQRGELPGRHSPYFHYYRDQFGTAK